LFSQADLAISAGTELDTNTFFRPNPHRQQPLTHNHHTHHNRIDNATLSLTTKSGSVSTVGDALANVLSEDTAVANIEGNLTNCLIFAESYNVLRVLSGMGMSLIPIHLSRITHANSKRRVLTPILTRHTPQADSRTVRKSGRKSTYKRIPRIIPPVPPVQYTVRCAM